jgi:hypothetical protein|tara:strand:- start:411 stop:644 length:234 start_codon:yes stop_codon:yes gene_type:complete
MLSILSLAKALEKEPNRSNICPECGDAQVLRWDSAGGGRNITLTSLRHEQCYKKYWKSIKEFDYKVTVKVKSFQEDT